MTAVLTLALVRQRADHVLTMDARGSDPEAAHGSQDALYVDVLRAVAYGHPESREMALEALRLHESPGTRWFA